MEEESSGGGGGVDLIRQGPEADSVAVELFGEVDEVLHGAAEAVEFPDDKGVAVAEMLERWVCPLNGIEAKDH